MAKKVFIIPGYTELPSTKGYKEIAAIFRKKGYDVTVVNITWKRRTMKDYVDQFVKIAEKEKGEFSVLGFSFGAMVAAISAPELKPKKLFLCSLSPYFKEDMKYVLDAWEKSLGKKRFDVFRTLSFSEIAKGIHCPTYIFVGEAEVKKYKSLGVRAKDAAKKIRGATLTYVPNGKHDISQEEYQKAVKSVIDRF